MRRRILIVGGKKHNIPLEKFSSDVEVIQYEQDSREAKKGEININKLPHAILCLNSFIGHNGSDRFRKKAKALGIPFISSRGGMSNLIEAAARSGFDLTGYMVDEKMPKIDKSTKKWIHIIPKHAQRIASGGHQLYYVRNKRSENALLFKGEVLEDAIKEVVECNYGSGKRGMLTEVEAQDVIDALDHKYDFTRLGITLSTNTVIKNVGFIMGTLSEAAIDKMRLKIENSIKKKGKKSSQKSSQKPAKMSKKQIRKQTKSKMLRKEELSKEVSADIEKLKNNTETTMQKMNALYDRIIDLEKQNTYYIEEISSLEKDKDELIKEINKFKKIIEDIVK